MRSLGIDVGGTTKGFDLVLMDGGRVPFVVRRRASLNDVARVIDEGQPTIVAIDSPPAWAPDGGSRRTELELAALNIQSFRTPAASRSGKAFFDWMRHGMRAFELAETKGYRRWRGGPMEGRAIEVFPHASATVLAGCLKPPGMRTKAWRTWVLRRERVRVEELTTLDLVDAALAALTGLLALAGHESHPGDPKEGVIVVPARALLPKYRPGTAPPDDTEPLIRSCACGEPGCDRLVRPPREFAPGHGAKRKSVLWKLARAGQDATDELRRRGWELPPEMR